MVSKLFSALLEYSKKYSKRPWASFNITEFTEDNAVKVEFRWNNQFIKKIKEIGFHAETEEESVAMFFQASQMRPDVNSVNSDAHPNLKTGD